jgi:hypothetical protein
MQSVAAAAAPVGAALQQLLHASNFKQLLLLSVLHFLPLSIGATQRDNPVFIAKQG